MSNTELKPCPFCCVTPVMATVGRDWVRLKTQCDDACLLHDKEFDYSLSDENRQILIDGWNQREPKDKWIPIEDTSKLKYGDGYKIKTDNSELFGIWVCGCRYESDKDNKMAISRGFFFVLEGAFNDAERMDWPNIKRIEINDVLYYQPLPEARK